MCLMKYRKTVDDYEAKISRLGGGYATQRHELQKNESVLEERTSSLEEKIREICLDALPFSMIPRQLEQLVAQINQDQEITKNHLEKQILEENLSQVSGEISGDKFWNDFKVDSNLKKEISSKIENLFQAKIPSMSETQNPVIDLSPNETVKIH